MQSKEDFIRERIAECNNYQNLLRALLALKKHFESRNSKYYFGGKLKKEGKPDQTPDIVIELEGQELGLIGEAKKSLRGRDPNRPKEEYILEYIEGKIVKQLKKYDTSFDNFQVKKHNLFLLAPQANLDALGILKFDYLDKKKDLFERTFSIITYSIELRGNTKQIIVKMDYGSIDNERIFDDLRRGIGYFEGELSEEIGRYKIFEENENSTPLEYIMLILWDSIFNEILNSSSKENVLKQYKERENKFSVKLTQLMDYLNRMYTLPIFNGQDNSSQSNDRPQFKKKVVIDAMEVFCFMGLAKILDKNGSEITYEVILKSLPEREELSYFLKNIYELIKTKPSIPNTEGIEKLSKYF